MAGSNLEQVRRAINLFDEGEIEAALEMVDDDFVMDWSNSIGPLKGVYTGRGEVLEVWRTFTDAWESVRWDIQEAVELDPDHVLVVNRVLMRGKGSGAEVDASGTQVWAFEEGRGKRLTLYQAKEDALAAFGR